MSRSLRQSGFSVIAASDGLEALKLFAEHGADVVITDLFMPIMDGIDLIMNLVSAKPDLPVIAITGAPTSNPRARTARMFGAERILAKPCRQEELADAVSRALDR